MMFTLKPGIENKTYLPKTAGYHHQQQFLLHKKKYKWKWALQLQIKLRKKILRLQWDLNKKLDEDELEHSFRWSIALLTRTFKKTFPEI